MLDKLKSTDFTPYLNQKFRIQPESVDPIEVELVEVTELGSESPDSEGNARRRPFSIVFRGPVGIVLPQRIYQIVHKEMGTLGLFLVPIGPDQAGMRYEAVLA